MSETIFQLSANCSIPLCVSVYEKRKIFKIARFSFFFFFCIVQSSLLQWKENIFPFQFFIQIEKKCKDFRRILSWKNKQNVNRIFKFFKKKLRNLYILFLFLNKYVCTCFYDLIRLLFSFQGIFIIDCNSEVWYNV